MKNKSKELVKELREVAFRDFYIFRNSFNGYQRQRRREDYP